MTILGVISDTHIPDRVPQLNPRILQVFRQAGVQQILHAGDIMIQAVLDELAQVAPVRAVRGNRDVWNLKHLPAHLQFEVDGVRIGLTHGHGTLSNYIYEKFDIAFKGKRVGRYLQRVVADFPEADVIVFGHLHVAGILHLDGKLLLNPGSASCPYPRSLKPSVALIHIQSGKARAEIVEL
jgi:putative phosphoesterase